MMQRNRTLYGLFALLFLVVVSIAGFFHTETDGQFDPSCPICQLQASSIGTHQPVCILDFITVQFTPVAAEPESPVCDHHPPTAVRLRAPPTR